MVGSVTEVRRGFSRAWPGVLLAAGIALAAHLVVRPLEVIPDVVAALMLGVLASTLGAGEWARTGAKLVVRYGLRLAIVALGAGLDLAVATERGWLSLLLIVTLVTVALSLGLLIGRLAGLDRTVSVLVGVGTAICGASAILAVSPIIRARERETAYAITTIFAFNIVALLGLPFIGHVFEMSQLRFGTWVGTAVNDTSVVVATGYVYGPIAGGVATLVKLTRTVLLVPVCVFVGLAFGAPDDRGSVLVRAGKSIPWFVLGFLALAAVNTSRVAPAEATHVIAQAGSLALVVVIAAVGLGVDLKAMLRMGLKPLVIGFGLASAMMLISIAAISVLRIA